MELRSLSRRRKRRQRKKRFSKLQKSYNSFYKNIGKFVNVNVNEISIGFMCLTLHVKGYRSAEHTGSFVATAL